MDSLIEDVSSIQVKELVRRRPYPIPDMRLASLATRGESSMEQHLQARESGNAKGSGVDATPIVIGVVIPTIIAAIILFVLHRRHQKKQKLEDSDERHKSLDFGLGDVQALEKPKPTRNAKKTPEMTVKDTDGVVRRDRGLSMDLALTNPYLLPPELQQSRESLHSLSRTLNTGDDKYRATTFVHDDGSVRYPSSVKSKRDDSSTYTVSIQRRFETDSQRALNSTGRRHEVPEVDVTPEPSPKLVLTSPTSGGLPNRGLLAPQTGDTTRDSYLSTTSSNGATAALRASNNYLSAYISGGAKKDEAKKDARVPTTTVTEVDSNSSSPSEQPQEPPAVAIRDQPSQRSSSVYEAQPHQDSTASYHHEATLRDRQARLPQLSVTPASDPIQQPDQHETEDTQSNDQREQEKSNLGSPAETPSRNSEELPTLPNIQVTNPHRDDEDAESDYYDEVAFSDYENDLGYADSNRRSAMGQRPLPPDDPFENPEQRANRIRSFYKEYFDDSNPNKQQQARQQSQQPQQVNYYDGSEDYVDDYYGSHGGSQGPSPYRRHRATISNGSYASAPRAYSSMSGRYGASRARPAPQKKLPPPKPLQVLPTPSKLQDDSFLPNAAEYAPPQVFKRQRAGTPDSLRGGLRPYSPGVRAHVPLMSSMDDLAVMPSPHQLRKSGTFSALDFAPPGKLRSDVGTTSETGSVHSNRSGLSAMHQHSIRTGAYRVSRIPKDVGGTRDEMTKALRPQWNMHR